MKEPEKKDILKELEKSLREGIESWTPQEGSLLRVLTDLRWFLKEKPEPPREWMDRLGEQAPRYDYHQVVLPQELCDPEADEEENLDSLIERFGKKSFLALEYTLITRNHFLWTSGHRPALELTGPLLMLESMDDNPELDWDCFFYIFSDESFCSYSLENDSEEMLGMDGREELRLHKEVFPHMRLHFGIEGEDYGIIGPIEA